MRQTSIGMLLQTIRGSAMPMVGLGIFALVGATGAAVDMARVEMAQSKLSTALDAAGLAAGANISTVNVNTEALKYFNANFPAGYVGSTVHDFNVTTASNNYVINLSVKADVPTTMMKLFGKTKVTVSATSQVTRAAKGMELILVMDNTGSMAQSAGGSISKIQAAQTAAITMLNILYGSNNTVPNLWVGLVPFSQAVNIGTSHPTWLDTTYDSTLNFGPTIINKVCAKYNTTSGTYITNPGCTYTMTSTTTPGNFGQANWQGCVESRSNGTATPQYDINDDPPSVKLFRQYNWPSDTYYNTWISSTPNKTCTTGRNPKCTINTTTTTYDYSSNSTLGTNKGANAECPHPVQPMVAEKSTLVTAINAMTPEGDTHIDLGLAWGWRMLSPRWRTLWGGEMNTNNLPLDYNTPLMNKVVILMTDGDNTISQNLYSAYGYPTSNQLGSNECSGSNCATGISQLDARTTAVCKSMKAQGILIYTVALGSSVSSAGQTLLQNCATKPAYYFLSPTTSSLQTAFQQIGDSLANLRISQ